MQIFGYFFHQCDFLGYLNWPYANFGLFFSISAIFWANLANANFFQKKKSHQTRTLCISLHLEYTQFDGCCQLVGPSLDVFPSYLFLVGTSCIKSFCCINFQENVSLRTPVHLLESQIDREVKLVLIFQPIPTELCNPNYNWL